MDRPPRPHRSAPALAGLAVVLIWVVLAGWRPTTTWHLAPLLIVLAPPWMAAHRPDRHRLRWIGVGVGLALATTLVLDLLQLLRGPVLVGSDATIEAVLAITAGAILGLVLPHHPDEPGSAA